MTRTMAHLFPQCQNLQEQVKSLLQLLYQEPSLRSQDVRPVEASLRKAISPTFEIVFAGAFSAGKSMLINALLDGNCCTVRKDTPLGQSATSLMPSQTKNESSSLS